MKYIKLMLVGLISTVILCACSSFPKTVVLNGNDITSNNLDTVYFPVHSVNVPEICKLKSTVVYKIDGIDNFVYNCVGTNGRYN